MHVLPWQLTVPLHNFSQCCLSAGDICTSDLQETIAHVNTVVRPNAGELQPPPKWLRALWSIAC